MTFIASPAPRCAAGLALVAALATGCGQGAAGAPAPGTVAPPAPIPTVEAFCMADYFQYRDLTELVSAVDAVVRVTATGPSRDYDVYPDPPTGSDPAVNPQYGVPPEEVAKIRPIPASALTVQVTQVLSGDLHVGDVIEVSQNSCTQRPLPAGPERDYALALRAPGGQGPWVQPNDTQAAWQVGADEVLYPVNPDNDLGVHDLDQLAAAASIATPWTPVG